MAIKVEVSNPKSKKDIEYPCIMIHKDGDLLVLFTKEGHGTVVDPNGNYYLGEHCDQWTMSNFTPFEGTVTLSNTK